MKRLVWAAALLASTALSATAQSPFAVGVNYQRQPFQRRHHGH
jgi:hypothetical protein